MEPGKDGVGDYTRLLAGALKRKGHIAAVLAIADRYIEESVLEEQIVSEKCSINVFRLPFDNNLEDAGEWVTSYNADYFSLQYVPYSFSNKGIHKDLINRLLWISQGGNWHIMFHELWIGMEQNASVKDSFIGRIQQLTIKRLAMALKPILITTQIELYRKKLKDLKVEAEILPLFSNIPVQNFQGHSTSRDTVQLVIFGNIHPENHFASFVEQAHEYQKKKKRKLKLVIIGREHPEQKKWKQLWDREQLEADYLGECPPHEISEILRKSSIGLSTTSLAKIEKSGSVAAMVEHGLKIISLGTSDKTTTKPAASLPIYIIDYNNIPLADCIEKGLIKHQAFSGLESVASTFEKLLLK